MGGLADFDDRGFVKLVAKIVNLFDMAMRPGLEAGNPAYAIFAYSTGVSDLESMLPRAWRRQAGSMDRGG